MDRDLAWNVLAVVVVVVGLAVAALSLGVVEPPWTSDAATVTLVDENGERLATVAVEVADTGSERYQGLSGRESLANGTGMLFVHSEERSLTYVMRRMNFGLDIIFVGADGRINGVTHAPPPGPDQDGNDIRRSGRGKYVLEVPRGYADAKGITAGDIVRIEYGDDQPGETTTAAS